MIVKLLTEHHLEFLSLKGGREARPSLHISKCHIVGNHMHWLINVKCLIAGYRRICPSYSTYNCTKLENKIHYVSPYTAQRPHGHSRQ